MTSPLLAGIEQILCRGAEKEMLGSDTWRIIAVVADEQSASYRPIVELIGVPMCSDVGIVSGRELPIAAIIDAALPEPAAVRLLYLGPETLLWVCRRVALLVCESVALSVAFLKGGVTRLATLVQSVWLAATQIELGSWFDASAIAACFEWGHALKSTAAARAVP